MQASAHRNRTFIVLGIMLLFTLAGCAGNQSHGPVTSLPSGQHAVMIEAGDYKFQPGDIQLIREGTLELNVKNVSGKDHNLTVKNPAGEKIISVDLPPNKTVTVAVDLPEPGTYEFYCDKPFHSTLGMTGRIVVLAPTGG